MLVDEIIKEAKCRGLSHMEFRNGNSPYSGGALVIGTKEAVCAASNAASGVRLDAEVRGVATTEDPASAYKGRVGRLTVVVVRANPKGKYVCGTAEEIKIAKSVGYIPLSAGSNGEYALVPADLREERLDEMKRLVFGGFNFSNVEGWDKVLLKVS